MKQGKPTNIFRKLHQPQYCLLLRQQVQTTSKNNYIESHLKQKKIMLTKDCQNPKLYLKISTSVLILMKWPFLMP